MKNGKTALRLAYALKLNNMKAAELAERTGLTKSAISQYVNGKAIPGSKSAAKIGKVLNVSPVWLMGFEVPMTKKVVSSITLNKEAALKAKEIYDDENTRILLDAKRSLKEEDLKAVVTLITSLIEAGK